MSSVYATTRFNLAVCIFLMAQSLLAEDNSPQGVGVCEGCHGKAGISTNPLVPTLAGQPFTLIEDNLLAFRAGNRNCSPSRLDSSESATLARTMCSHVKTLQDADIVNLAEFFEDQQFIPARQSFEMDLAQRGGEIHEEKGCERCHSDGGQATNGMAPVLSGQWSPYLRRAMTALREGKKRGPHEMNQGIESLSDAEVEALLNFYASRRGSA